MNKFVLGLAVLLGLLAFCEFANSAAALPDYESEMKRRYKKCYRHSRYRHDWLKRYYLPYYEKYFDTKHDSDLEKSGDLAKKYEYELEIMKKKMYDDDEEDDDDKKERYGRKYCANKERPHSRPLYFGCPRSFEPKDHAICCGKVDAEFCCKKEHFKHNKYWEKEDYHHRHHHGHHHRHHHRDHHGHHHGHHRGNKMMIGIIVGVVVAVAAIISISVGVVIHKKKQARRNITAEQPGQKVSPEMSKAEEAKQAEAFSAGQVNLPNYDNLSVKSVRDAPNYE